MSRPDFGIRFECKACQRKLSVDKSAVGKNIRCPACGEKIRIPGEVPSLLSGMKRLFGGRTET